MDEYDYAFPKELIARTPASPRDVARLLTYNRTTGVVLHRVFRDLPSLLPAHAVLVMNDTKVIPARVLCTRTSGGRVEMLYLRHTGRQIVALLNKKLKVGEELLVGGKVCFVVESQHGREWILQCIPDMAISSFLEQRGQTPIPPYIKQSPMGEQELRREYQTVFATQEGSVAAPTASLHFTEGLLTQLEDAGISIVHTTLHVGLGTFAPLTAQALAANTLHEEWYSISQEAADAINAANNAGRPIIAVGTTVVRTLESAADSTGHVVPGSGATSIFIRPPYTFKMVDGMITNFHVPKSSLMMLVASFIGREKLLELYADAIAKKYRLFSFGDAMLLL